MKRCDARSASCRTDTSPREEQIKERHEEKESRKRALKELCATNPAVAAAVEAGVHSFAGDPNEPASFDALHELLEAQAYQLAYWRVASDDINYRRFFDVNSLAALRVENDTVFETTHRLATGARRRGDDRRTAHRPP